MKLFKKHLKVISLIASLLYIALMFVMAVVSKNIPKFVTSEDKLMHSIEFFILMVILLITFEIWNVQEKTLLAFIGLLILTISSEVLQIFILNRTFSAYDMIADLTGGIIGFLLVSGIKIIFLKNENIKKVKTKSN